MRNVLKKLTLLMVPFLLVGCNTATSSAEESSKEESKTSSQAPSSSKSSSSSEAPTSTHQHSWASEWSQDDNNHWHACSGCDEKKDNAAHTFGEWQTVNLGELLKDSRFDLSNAKYRVCSTCNYEQIDKSFSAVPEVKFTFDPNDANANFATVAKSTDTSRPKVKGTLTIANAGDKYSVTEGYTGEIKVRGNQTAGFDKKGFQIKLDKKQNLLGLNGGKKFKKWVLLADAKDITVSRTSLGLLMCKGVIGDDSNVWSSDFMPVSVYLNNEYWGLYMLAEQKEVKKGRIKLDEPIETIVNPDTGEEEEVDITTTDIGYCFEMDYYAKNEANKGADGDPTFSIDYGSYFTQNSYKIESGLANASLGIVKTYTMNSDITDSTAGKNEHTDETKSNQLKFIKARLQALFNVLYQATKGKAYDINAENQAVATTELTVKQAIEKNFDLNAWAEGFIINAVCLPPDVGYSSFYMSFDNTPTGDKKLRFDNPWDFDSNFGNRKDFIEKPDVKNGNFDPYFMDRTANMWLQFLGKLDFFMDDYVKPKWNAVREKKVFEGMLNMLDVCYRFYEGEYQRNFTKWPSIMPSDPNLNYFSNELRELYREPSNRKQAQQETINWLTKRVDYLEGKWGNNRPSVGTTK